MVSLKPNLSQYERVQKNLSFFSKGGLVFCALYLMNALIICCLMSEKNCTKRSRPPINKCFSS